MHTESLHRVGVLVRHNAVLRLRDPGQIISYLVTPMVLMLVFKPLYTRALSDGTVQIVTGPLVMFSVFTLAITGNAILVEREWRTWDLLRTSPASAAELLLGKSLPVFLILVLQQTLLMIYGCLVVGLQVPSSFGLVAVAILAWSLALLGLGTALATILRSHAEMGLVSDLGAIVISALGGALVPVSIMPGWAQAVAHASPGYWALATFQSAVHGDGPGTFGNGAVLLALALLTGGYAVFRMSRGWGRSDLL